MRKESSTNFINNHTLENYCNAHKILSQISGRWKLSIIFALSESQLNYSDFKKRLPNITDRILAKQLNELKKDEIIGNEKTKLKSVYFLTKKGNEMMRILISFKNFNSNSI
ncbi:transcriptional regulator [Tenacibaculum sp. Bg11-29]|uniref:winged helix-turn-helix transcriptional regulator n=1 Tax=Tenacibaculum sp. Bg11-29 TaxID=2058306 RepID=UPI000C32FA92|nr:helix-turn-helix domain-containing protein [Tenacibaculum sp. Bg11-29]PKH50586.1 transcriptional regulator [Tenacibaculum sp. Bg11-29]